MTQQWIEREEQRRGGGQTECSDGPPVDDYGELALGPSLLSLLSVLLIHPSSHTSIPFLFSLSTHPALFLTPTKHLPTPLLPLALNTISAFLTYLEIAPRER